MQSQDLEVLRAAQAAINEGRSCWLATVVAVHGSSPRPPGSMALFLPPSSQVGSLSGGCVEEVLLADIAAGVHDGDTPAMLRYGVSAEENARLGLPCGGHLQVFLQHLGGEHGDSWLEHVLAALAARECHMRRVDVRTGACSSEAVECFRTLELHENELRQCFGPRQRMLLIGAGQLACSVAELALAMDYDVIVCDPRDAARNDWRGPEVPLLGGMPDDAVLAYASDPQSLVITLTHDPRIDDMALMEALETDAWYVGALGSKKTTQARLERLRMLDVDEAALARLRAPVGLDIGSKTPPEIAVSIMAELTQLRRRAR